MSLIVELIDTKKELIDKFHQNIDELEASSSGFMNELRHKALEHFKTLGIPSTKDEDYRYTNLEPWFKKEYSYRFAPKLITFAISDIFNCDIPELNTNTIILLNGWYISENGPMTVLANGIKIGSLSHAAKTYPELVEKHYGRYAISEKDGLVALNTAYAQDGIFIHVPKNVVLEQPLQIINMLLDDESLMVQHRNLFIFEENSQANIIVCDHTLSEYDFLTNSVTEVFAGNNAHFDLTKMQNEHNNATQLSATYVHQKKDSHVTTNTITLHGGMIRNNVQVVMDDEGCENQTFGMYFIDRKQHVSNHTIVEHAKPNCYSNQKFKGVLDDEGTGAFNGKILVAEDAQNTRAYQTNNNILLTDTATMNTKPQLEIYADDVKCSHGATVGQLDENALFYLRSRGIDESEARLLLMYAFADEIINEIRVPVLRERIENLVDKRLRGELSRCNNCDMNCC
jgi:Fe-S cluster assembly protein SufD